ncbi:MAG: hypothetical protein RMM31_10555 [Anaerolineae bacterium]|nr:hypothetical protein [Thermoflexales bacterium]MDW8396669.1 hypothetical protein [Anaerolineae bacterium]
MIALPDLRILPLNALIPHERTDPRRVAPLVERLRAEAVLRNPPIVAPLDAAHRQFVVLDGANRTAALLALGVPHVLAQVVDYRAVTLSVWHHVIARCDAPQVLRTLSALEGLEIVAGDLTSARAALARREALAYMFIEDGEGKAQCLILLGGHNLRTRTDLLNQVVDAYEGCARVQRTIAETLAEARAAFPEAALLVVFPRYERDEIVDLVRNEVRLPAGITRHVLPLRALRLNYPMDVLRSDLPLARKQAHLSEWIHERLIQRQVRTYEEPTVLFDE